MKPIDVKWITYINVSVENNETDPKFEVVDHVKISKYKNIFEKVLFEIGLKKFL